MLGTLGVVWGLGGVIAMLSYAVFRLTPYMLEVVHLPLEWYHWLALAVNVLFMAHSEGYKGFQKSFAPRVAARARHLKRHPKLLHVFFSPFFCVGYFYTPVRRRLTIIGVTLGVLCLVFLVRHLDQPWRGIVDTGVVVGLIWGIVSVLMFSLQALTQEEFNHSAELPSADPSAQNLLQGNS